MPVFIFSDFLDKRVDLLYLFEDARSVMLDLGDLPADSAAFKAIMSQVCSYSGAPTPSKKFHRVVLPQYIVKTATLPPCKAMLGLAMAVFRLKTRHFRAPELGGDGNVVVAVKREGVYFLFFSDAYHYVPMHHLQSPLRAHHFCFVPKPMGGAGTTEYAADCAVQTYRLLEKYRDFAIV
jgi:hypothetical protein